MCLPAGGDRSQAASGYSNRSPVIVGAAKNLHEVAALHEVSRCIRMTTLSCPPRKMLTRDYPGGNGSSLR